MTAPFFTFQSANGWWVFNDQRIYCWNASEADALVAVAENFGPDFDLGNEVDAATFKTMVSAGTQATLASVDAAIAEREESEATERLRSLLKLTLNAVSALTEAIDREAAAIEEQNEIAKQQAKLEEERRAAEAKRIAELKAAQARQRAAMLEEQEQQKREAEQVELKRRDRRYFVDKMSGEVTLTENANDHRFKTARKIIGRWTNIEAARAAGHNV